MPAAPTPPDYTNYIAEMTRIGNLGQDRSQQLFDWAQQHGVSYDQLAALVSGRAANLSDEASQSYHDLMGNWEKTTSPLYDAQAADAMKMMADLPGYQEKMAGAAGADVDQAMDAAKKTQQRNLQGEGLTAPSIGQGAIDTAFGAQRAAAKVAAEENARMAARGEARGVVTNALNSEAGRAGIAGQQGGFSLAAGNQQINAPLSAGSTTAGLQQPGISYYNASYPWMGQWGSTMSNAYNQELAAFNANQNASAGTGALLGGLGGGLLSFAGSATGGKLLGSIFGGSGPTTQSGGLGGAGASVPGGITGSTPGGYSYPSTSVGVGYEGGGAINPTMPSYDDGGGVSHANEWMSIPGEIVGALVGAYFGAPGIGMAAGKNFGTTFGDLLGGKTENLGGDIASGIPGIGDSFSQYSKGTGLTGLVSDQIGGEGGGIAGMGVGEGLSQGAGAIFAGGGEAQRFVPPQASQSRGAITDDVPARLNVGEFVFPKDVVAWRGEQWMQKEIQKARQDRAKNEQAKPEMGSPDGAINMNAPTFSTAGAPA